MTFHTYTPNQCRNQVLTSYTLQFLTLQWDIVGQDFKGQDHYSKVKSVSVRVQHHSVTSI